MTGGSPINVEQGRVFSFRYHLQACAHPPRLLAYSAISTWERPAKWQPNVSLNVGKVLYCKDALLYSTVVLKLTHGVEALLCRTDDLDSWPPAYLLIIVFTTEYALPLLFNAVRRQALNWEYNKVACPRKTNGSYPHIACRSVNWSTETLYSKTCLKRTLY